MFDPSRADAVKRSPTLNSALERRRGPQDSLADSNVQAVITVSQANDSTGVVTLIGSNQRRPLLSFVRAAILGLVLPHGTAEKRL